MFHLGEEMRADQDRELKVAVKLPDQFAHFMDALGIEPLAGFIQDQNPWPRQQGLRQGEALPHPVRVDTHGIVNSRSEPDQFHHFLNFRCCHRTAIGAKDLEILPSGQVRIKRRRFKNGPHLA